MCLLGEGVSPGGSAQGTLFGERKERGRNHGVGRNAQPVEKQAAAEEERSNAQHKAIQKYGTEAGKKM